MPDSKNLDNMIRIIHSIDDPVVANTNTPTVLRAREFATA
jgi:hypothetical protein